MTFSAFMMAYFKSLAVDQRLAKSAGTRGLRQGQLLANMLRELRPDLADMLRGSELDPFYRFSVRDATWEWLAAHWGSQYETDLDGDGPWAEVADVSEEVADGCLG